MNLRAKAIFEGTHTARLVLFGSGLMAVTIAVAILFAPAAFYAGYGIEVTGDATLANDLKAPAGALLVAGLVMFAGAFRRELAIGAICLLTLLQVRQINTN